MKPLRIRVCRAKNGFYLEQKAFLGWTRVDWQDLRGAKGFDPMPETFDTEANAEAAAKQLLKADLASRMSTTPKEVTYVWGEDEQESR